MKLHAKNLALAAGAKGKEVELIATQLVRDKKISASYAEKALENLRLALNSESDIHIDTFLDTQQNTTPLRRRGTNNHRIDDTSHELNAYIDRVRREVLL
jgi:hypothetical protein